MYHGTPQDEIKEFSIDKVKMPDSQKIADVFTKGFYFSKNRDTAKYTYSIKYETVGKGAENL
nr:MAG TPA: Protein of unknown function (DUF3990) [Caudoviricetes sp.]